MEHILFLEEAEYAQRVERNFLRLAEGEYYHAEQVFSPPEYRWYGDKEGRALLAFVSHYRINQRRIPCMEQMLRQLPSHLNEKGYMGPDVFPAVHEQQLSGHSWLLRGLCEHFEAFGDAFSLSTAQGIAQSLYLPLAGRFASYPTERVPKEEGGVSGDLAQVGEDWILSTDVGCAFMSIDGLSHLYRLTKNEALEALVREMCRVYLAIDKAALRAQTHCTLTAARGMLRMLEETGDPFYRRGAQEIWELYVLGGGITVTDQNLNWWGRPDTWTEPCAIVDSLMLSGELFRLTGEERYRAFAARAYHNGLATAQRDNGGAGTDSVVLVGGNEVLRAKMYEAYFCCTMRLAEGLRYLGEHKDFFFLRLEGEVTKKQGFYSDGDRLYGEPSPELAPYARDFVWVDGHRLCPLVKYYRVPKSVIETATQRVVFTEEEQ